MATGSEVDLSELMAHAMRNQKTVLLPRITGKGTMLSCVYDGHLQLGAYGIPEPTGKPCKPDLIICPMLAFNKERYRIGYGGGYYDRYLADSTAVFFGVAFQEQRQKFLAQAHDVPLHRIFTQVGVF